MGRTFAYYYNYIQNYTLADKYTREMIGLEGSLGRNNEIRRDVEFDIGQYYFNKKQFGEAATYFQKPLITETDALGIEWFELSLTFPLTISVYS